MDRVRTATRSEYIQKAVQEKIERDLEAERVATLTSLVDDETMNVTPWQAAQADAHQHG
jgi:hypothetical protein